MSKTCSALTAAAALGFFLLTTSAAQALPVSRAWVSGHGLDAAGCGAPTKPCRSLQYVLDNVVASGGEIDILDPAGYGAITISKPISFVNDGIGTAGVQASSGDAIKISVPGANDTVHLRGLTVEGLGTGGFGIYSNSTGTLEIIDCTVRNFAGSGIYLTLSSGQLSLLVSNSFVLGNGDSGVNIASSAGTTIISSMNNVTINDNKFGISVATAGIVEAQVSNSHIDNNTSFGIGSFGANVILSESTINQTPIGLSLVGNSNVWLSHVIQSAVPGISNTGIVRTGSDNVFSDGTSHLNSGPLSTWGFQ